MTNLACCLQCSIFSPWMRNCLEVLLCLLGCTTVSILLFPLTFRALYWQFHIRSQLITGYSQYYDQGNLYVILTDQQPYAFRTITKQGSFSSGQQMDIIYSFPF